MLKVLTKSTSNPLTATSIVLDNSNSKITKILITSYSSIIIIDCSKNGQHTPNKIQKINPKCQSKTKANISGLATNSIKIISTLNKRSNKIKNQYTNKHNILNTNSRKSRKSIKEHLLCTSVPKIPTRDLPRIIRKQV